MSQQFTRRHIMHRAGVVTASLFVGGSRRAHAAASAQVESTTVISDQPDLYHGWPTLARRKNGQLLLVCSGGREAHVCPFGRVELMRSDDDGQTWSWPQVLMDGPIDDRDAGVVETAMGSVLVTTFTSLAFEPILKQAETGKSKGWSKQRLKRWRAARDRIPQEQRQKELGVWMVRSTDGGVTWSARYRCQVNSPHGPIQLSDGRLLYVGKELWSERRRIGACHSRDDGQSWSWLATIPTRTNDDAKDYHELHAVESADGRIVAHIRNHNKQNARETLQTESRDGGTTWTTPHSIGVWGYPSSLLRLNDGRLLMSYGHRRNPMGNQARLSADHGQTWSEPMIISDDGTSGDLGYPTTVQLKDGSLLSVWYELLKGMPKAILRQAKWSIHG